MYVHVHVHVYRAMESYMFLPGFINDDDLMLATIGLKRFVLAMLRDLRLLPRRDVSRRRCRRRRRRRRRW